MRVTFCGVRGSTPAPGPEFVAVGGHTSCVAIGPGSSAAPTLLLDAGTGIREVTGLLDGAPFRGTILLSHLHWDHVQGLPFFAAGDRPDAVVTLGVPGVGPDDAEVVLERSFSPPHFPIRPAELHGRWRFEPVVAGPTDVEDLVVRSAPVPHKGGVAVGFRIDDPTGVGVTSLAYVPDHLPAAAGPERDVVVELVRGVEVLVHDAQFVAGEEAVAEAYGHSTIAQARALADEADVGMLVLFHHAPGRTDDQVLAIERAAAALPGRQVVAARQGGVLDGYGAAITPDPEEGGRWPRTSPRT